MGGIQVRTTGIIWYPRNVLTIRWAHTNHDVIQRQISQLSCEPHHRANEHGEKVNKYLVKFVLFFGFAMVVVSIFEKIQTHT